MFPLRVFRDHLREPLFCRFLCVEAGDQRRLKVELEYNGPEELLRAPRVAFSAATGLRTHILRSPLSVTLTGPDGAKTVVATGDVISFGGSR